MDKSLKLMELLRRLRDPRMPRFGGHEYKGLGVGMGRFLLGLTAYAEHRNGKVLLSNRAF